MESTWVGSAACIQENAAELRTTLSGMGIRRRFTSRQQAVGRSFFLICMEQIFLFGYIVPVE